MSVRQMAARLLRHPPDAIADQESFRETLGRLLLESGGQRRVMRGATATKLPRDDESTLPLVVIDNPKPAHDLVLNPPDSAAVETFIREQQEAGRLAAAGLQPARTLLLIGPPGVGKTMTAAYIAHALQLPLVSLDLAAIVSSYLGRTGQNLRRALDYARTTACVLFLDEFDALAKRRDDDSDVGELKRIVNVLLLELERSPNDSVLIAATNHPELLDRAIERRFDSVVQLGRPETDARDVIIRSHLDGAGRSVDSGLARAVAILTDGWSGSDLSRLCQMALRVSVLEDVQIDVALANQVMSSSASAGATDELRRAAFAGVAVKYGGLSYRQVGRLLGVTHPTVSRLVRLIEESTRAAPV